MRDSKSVGSKELQGVCVLLINGNPETRSGERSTSRDEFTVTESLERTRRRESLKGVVRIKRRKSIVDSIYV